MICHRGRQCTTTFDTGNAVEYGSKSTPNLDTESALIVDKAELPTAGMIDSQSIKTTEKKGRYMALTEVN